MLPTAILLIGPTGVGKSPLGDSLEASMRINGRYLHFDFGFQLRKTVLTFPKTLSSDNTSAKHMMSQQKMLGLSINDIKHIKKMLSGGALLEDNKFYIAKHILVKYCNDNNISKNDIIILNGFPRHCGQAIMMDSFICIKKIFVLTCNDDVIFDRIQKNSGNDRTGRTDDYRELVVKKIATFKDRTKKLISFYKRKEIPIIEIPVTSSTLASDTANSVINSI